MSRIEQRNLREDPSPAADIAMASSMLIRLETLDAARRGETLADARKRVARLLHAAPRTLESIRYRALKAIPSWLLSRIRAELVNALSAEARRLAHEIQIHRQAGVHPSDVALAEAQAALATARKILSEAMR